MGTVPAMVSVRASSHIVSVYIRPHIARQGSCNCLRRKARAKHVPLDFGLVKIQVRISREAKWTKALGYGG